MQTQISWWVEVKSFRFVSSVQETSSRNIGLVNMHIHVLVIFRLNVFGIFTSNKASPPLPTELVDLKWMLWSESNQVRPRCNVIQSCLIDPFWSRYAMSISYHSQWTENVPSGGNQILRVLSVRDICQSSFNRCIAGSKGRWTQSYQEHSKFLWPSDIEHFQTTWLKEPSVERTIGVWCRANFVPNNWHQTCSVTKFHKNMAVIRVLVGLHRLQFSGWSSL